MYDDEVNSSGSEGEGRKRKWDKTDIKVKISIGNINSYDFL
jgi:hypothetical protein